MSKTAPSTRGSGQPPAGPVKGEHTWPKFVIGTIAGVGATILAAVVGGSQNVNIFNGIAPVPTTTVTATATATETVTAPAATPEPGGDGTLPTASASADSPGVLAWHEKVHVPDGYDLDVDGTGPKVRPHDADADVVGRRSGEGLPLIERRRGGTLYGTLNNPSPTKAQCRKAIDTAAAPPPILLSSETTVCLVTDADLTPHVAAVRLISWDKGKNVMYVDVTVWAA